MVSLYKQTQLPTNIYCVKHYRRLPFKFLLGQAGEHQAGLSFTFSQMTFREVPCLNSRDST